MMFTRSAARALLTNRVTIHNDNLPEDVLLEIFDAYRQLYHLLPGYEDFWNSRNGWFKLAHVCLRWRRLVLLSSSRLHVHLLFTPSRSSRDPVLRCLPRLPILIDYSDVSWTEKAESLALAAIMHHSRVRGITLRRPCAGRILQALSHPFPKLESFKICSTSTYLYEPELNIPTTFLLSAPCLRRLTLREIGTRRLSPLLSSATGLVELALTLRVPYGALPEASLIANLQRLSCLRRLELRLSILGIAIPDSPSPPACTDVVPLSKLTDLILMGHAPFMEMLVVRLAAPSLQHLDAAVWNGCSTFPVPHLCKFISNTECRFTVVRLDLLQWKLKLTCTESDHAQPFMITVPESASLEQIGNTLSGPLSTVEKLVVEWDAVRSIREPNDIQWRGFFHRIPKTKVVHVPTEAVPDIVHSFHPDGQEPAVDLLPALEHVKVHMMYYLASSSFAPIESYSNDQYASISDAFQPLIAARQQVGRPIKVLGANCLSAW